MAYMKHQARLDHSPSYPWKPGKSAGFRAKRLSRFDSRCAVWKQYPQPDGTVGVLAVSSTGSGYSFTLVCTQCTLTDSHPFALEPHSDPIKGLSYRAWEPPDPGYHSFRSSGVPMPSTGVFKRSFRDCAGKK